MSVDNRYLQNLKKTLYQLSKVQISCKKLTKWAIFYAAASRLWEWEKILNRQPKNKWCAWNTLLRCQLLGWLEVSSSSCRLDQNFWTCSLVRYINVTLADLSKLINVQATKVFLKKYERRFGFVIQMAKVEFSAQLSNNVRGDFVVLESARKLTQNINHACQLSAKGVMHMPPRKSVILQLAQYSQHYFLALKSPPPASLLRHS